MGQIPHTKIHMTNGIQMHFNLFDIKNCLKNGLAITNHNQIKKITNQIQRQFPQALAELQELDKQFTGARVPKRYSLHKVKNKKLGFVYYTRYIENGRQVPSRWSTRTNNEEAAINFALSNRDRILSEYHQRRAHSNSSGNLFKIMKNYYKKNSPYLKKDALRGRTLKDNTRQTYHNSITRYWMPFLKKQHIKTIDEIDTSLIAHFQDYCLARGIKRQTVNHNVSYVSRIFDYLLTRGHIKNNPCKTLPPLRVGKEDQKVTGCYNVDKINGVFNKRWEDQLSYMLDLLIYTTRMRDCEIERIQIKDLIKISNVNFIDIPDSKTEYGERQVPLHNFVYKKLTAYAWKNNKKKPEDYIFKNPKVKTLGSRVFKKAYMEMAKHMDYTEEQVKKENIKFYSGRHFWKTLTRDESLGVDIEEIWMGHSVKNDVSKRYLHIDKQSLKNKLEKTRKLFNILDRKVFRK